MIVLPVPEREGWLFLGWNTAPGGSGEYLQTTPEGRQEDLTLYAIWQEIMLNGSAENFEYKIGPESVIITGYTGSFGKNVDLVIPSYIQGKPVVAVDGLFGSGDHYINSIAIPGTVKRLGDYGLSYMIITEPLTIPQACSR